MASLGSVPPIPVVIFTGYLGAGKTTAIQRIIPQLDARGEGTLVIVNDLSPDNTDVFAFRRQSPLSSALPSPSEGGRDGSRGGVAALSGGCVCCNLLGSLVEELLKAYSEGKCSYVVLECTGVADPAPVVATVSALPALADKYVVDAVVTVVNAANLVAATASTDGEEGGGASVTLDVARSDVMGGHQVLGANLVLINNWESLLSRGTATEEMLIQWPALLEKFCAEANPNTRVAFTDHGSIAFTDMVWRRNLFKADGVLPYYLRAYAATGKTVGDFAADGEEEEAYELRQLGLQVFTFCRTNLIVSTQRLRAAMSGSKAPGKRLLRRVWRSKGFFEAVDDEAIVTTARSGGAGERKQFRWQSVNRSFDYGEVLPPRVPLTDSRGDTNTALDCRIVFMGGFDREEQLQEVESFFASIAV